MFNYKLKIPFFVFIYLISLSVTTTAQVKYVSDSSYVNTLSVYSKNQLGKFSYFRIDTNINHFQNYFNRNSNGSYGLANAHLELSDNVSPLGFNVYQLPYQNDLFGAKNILYHQTKGPYANLTGIAGSKQEQQFKFLFTNTFKNKLNITVAFNRYSGLGFYGRQQSFTNNFYTTSNYSTKNKRFGYFANFCFNKLKHSENGGVDNDTLILENPSINKSLVGINFKNARRELRTTTAEFNPWFKLNKSDSSALWHFINYQFNYSGSFIKYTDPNSAFEKNHNTFYFDTLTTKDSLHWRTVTNVLNYRVNINALHTSLQVGAANEFNQVYQYLDSSFMNTSVVAMANYNYKGFNSLLKANYIVSGANQNDYLMEFNNLLELPIAKRVLKSNVQFKLNALVEQRHPDFIYNTWNTNHYSWANAFKPTQKMQALFSIATSDNRFAMGALAQSVNNYLYFNEQSEAQQTTVIVQNLKAFVKKDVLLFKHLGLNLGYIYQQSSYEAIVPIPNQIVNAAIYYQGNLFKNALQLQVGFNVQYYSSFYGNAYNVATNNYYVQTKQVVGNYPFADFFINARIKPVRFFVKLDHLNQGLSGSNYQLVPGYYQNDRAIKFGLNWLFFD